MTHTAIETLATLPGRDARISDYVAAGLTPDAADQLETHAERIARIGRRTIVDIGSELLLARRAAQHGTWLPFLGSVNIVERTAQHYMQVATFFEDKPAKLAYLPPRLLPAIAAGQASEADIDAIIADVQRGEKLTAVAVADRLARPDKPEHAEDTFASYAKAAYQAGYRLSWNEKTGRGQNYSLSKPGGGYIFTTWEETKQKIVELGRAVLPEARATEEEVLPFEVAPIASDDDHDIYDDEESFGESREDYEERERARTVEAEFDEDDYTADAASHRATVAADRDVEIDDDPAAYEAFVMREGGLPDNWLFRNADGLDWAVSEDGRSTAKYTNNKTIALGEAWCIERGVRLTVVAAQGTMPGGYLLNWPDGGIAAAYAPGEICEVLLAGPLNKSKPAPALALPTAATKAGEAIAAALEWLPDPHSQARALYAALAPILLRVPLHPDADDAVREEARDTAPLAASAEVRQKCGAQQILRLLAAWLEIVPEDS